MKSDSIANVPAEEAGLANPGTMDDSTARDSSISSKLNEKYLELSVEDDGNGAKSNEQVYNKQGIGIKNVNARLKKMYGENFKLDFVSPNGHGFISRIELPLKFEKGGER